MASGVPDVSHVPIEIESPRGKSVVRLPRARSSPRPVTGLGREIERNSTPVGLGNSIGGSGGVAGFRWMREFVAPIDVLNTAPNWRTSSQEAFDRREVSASTLLVTAPVARRW